MTRTGSLPGGREQEQPAAGRRNPYLDILRGPGTLAFSSAGLVGRMSMSMYGLGTVLLIAALTGRYGIAGTVAAAGSVGYALFGPVAAQLADRFGQGRVLIRQALIFAVGTCAFIGCVEVGAPLWVLLVTGVLAGASMPSLGSMVRARWSALLDGDARRLHAAYSLESVNDEFIFVIGPALVTLLATQWLPAAGVGAATLLCVAGTLLFAVQRATEPAVRPGSARQRPALKRHRGIRLPALPVPALSTLAPAFLLLGAMFAAMDLSAVAFAAELGHRPVAGLILGTFALGSAVGGMWYGTRRWRAPPGRRFMITAAFAVLGISTFWAMPGLLALAAVGFLTGLWVAPTLIAGYAILEMQAPVHRRTEAMAWLSSTVSIGVAFGSAIVGHVIDARGARSGFGFAASCGAAAVLICLVGAGRLRTRAG